MGKRTHPKRTRSLVYKRGGKKIRSRVKSAGGEVRRTGGRQSRKLLHSFLLQKFTGLLPCQQTSKKSDLVTFKGPGSSRSRRSAAALPGARVPANAVSGFQGSAAPARGCGRGRQRRVIYSGEWVGRKNAGRRGRGRPFCRNRGTCPRYSMTREGAGLASRQRGLAVGQRCSASPCVRARSAAAEFSALLRLGWALQRGALQREVLERFWREMKGSPRHFAGRGVGLVPSFDSLLSALPSSLLTSKDPALGERADAPSAPWSAGSRAVWRAGATLKPTLSARRAGAAQREGGLPGRGLVSRGDPAMPPKLCTC